MVKTPGEIQVRITTVTNEGGGKVKVDVSTEKASEIYREVYQVASRHMGSTHANYAAQTTVAEYIEEQQEMAEEQRERELEAAEA